MRPALPCGIIDGKGAYCGSCRSAQALPGRRESRPGYPWDRGGRVPVFRSRFRLPPVRPWNVVAPSFALLGTAFALAGTLGIDGPLIIRWSGGGAPVGWAGKWILWALALMSALSVFAWRDMQKDGVGNAPVSEETACALSAALAAFFALTNGILVVYRLCPRPLVPVVGMAVQLGLLALFPLLACLRRRRRSGKDRRGHKEET